MQNNNTEKLKKIKEKVSRFDLTEKEVEDTANLMIDVKKFQGEKTDIEYPGEMI